MRPITVNAKDMVPYNVKVEQEFKEQTRVLAAAAGGLSQRELLHAMVDAFLEQNPDIKRKFDVLIEI